MATASRPKKAADQSRVLDARLAELEGKIHGLLREYAKLSDAIELLKDQVQNCARKRSAIHE